MSSGRRWHRRTERDPALPDRSGGVTPTATQLHLYGRRRHGEAAPRHGAVDRGPDHEAGGPGAPVEIEEKLGTIPEPRRGVPLHGLQQIMAMQDLVEEQINETIDEVSRKVRLHHEIVEAVMADPRV